MGLCSLSVQFLTACYMWTSLLASWPHVSYRFFRILDFELWLFAFISKVCKVYFLCSLSIMDGQES